MALNTLTKNILLTPFNLLYKISPQLDLKILFILKQGYRLNLKKPKTYNEKIQWIKLYDKNPMMPQCCDKYTVREYITSHGFGSILNHLIWEGFDPEDIPFDKLPEKFVIKITHGSTFNIICTDKLKLNKTEVIGKCRKWLKAKFLPCYGEWFYGKERPRIIIEDYIESDDGKQLKDYKIFCFHGKPKYIRVDAERFTDNHTKDVYDINWNLLKGIQMGYKSSNTPIQRPVCLEEMLNYASKLSADFLHARIDFYIIKNKIVFGEITFTNGAGFDKFLPYSFDVEMGSHLHLPLIK